MSDVKQGLIIRPFRDDDQAAARRLILEGLQDHFKHLDETMNPDLDNIAGFYCQQGHDFIVAERAGQIIATGALIGLNELSGRIARVSVARRARRQGVGRSILCHLIGLARERCYRELVTETNWDWVGAITFYESLGFQAYARDEESVHMSLSI